MADAPLASSATDMNLPVPPPPRGEAITAKGLSQADLLSSGTVRREDESLVLPPRLGPVEDMTAELPGIPGFHLERVLGRGAMGVVYLALQLSLNRPVALKMILAGEHASSQARQRFLGEAAAIAKVRHPGIVQVFEFGTHGRCPYFAMEHVAGGSLDRLLSRGPLPPAAAAHLVAQLADAVQAAHDAGIIHRDLKPANVLLAFSRESQTSAADSPALDVVSRLNTAVPKITDFGLAKQLNTGAELTASGAIMGTPSYMAPEQAGGRQEQIGAATDVYALGAILYECLTGRPPFKGTSMMDTLEQVVHQEPVAVRSLQPRVPRDLETICHKCLQKDPPRRYSAAQDLAVDLRNYLEGKPIQARPVGRLERGWKWCRRYPTAASLLAVSVLAAVGMGVLAAWALGEKSRAEAAESEQRRAQELAQSRLRQVTEGIQILASAFQSLDPKAELAEGLPLRSLLGKRLQQMVRQLEGAAVGEPLLVAQLQNILGKSLYGLGQYEQAITLLQKAAATQEALLGPEHPESLQTLNNLAATYHAAGDLAKAVPLLEKTLQRMERVLTPDDPAALSARNNLAEAYRAIGKPSQALELLQETLLRRQETLGTNHPSTLLSMLNLATWYRQAGQLPRALPLLKETVERYQTALGPEHPDTLHATNDWAEGLRDAGSMAQALALFNDTHRIQKAKLGPDHPETLGTLSNLAETYRLSGQARKAIPLQKEALERREAVLGKQHGATLNSLNNLAASYRDAGQSAQALPLFEELYQLRMTLQSPDHPETLTTMHNLATVRWENGQLDRALPLMVEAVRGRKAKLGPDHPSTLSSMGNLAEFYRLSGQVEKALPLREETLKLQEAKLGRDHPDTLVGMNNLAYLYQATGNTVKALPLYEEAMRRMRDKWGKDHPHTLFVTANLAQTYLTSGQVELARALLPDLVGKPQARAGLPPLPWAGKLEELVQLWLRKGSGSTAEIEALARECVEHRSQHLPKDHWLVAASQSLLGAVLLAQGKHTEAEEHLIAAWEGLRTARQRGQLPTQAHAAPAECLQRLIALAEAANKPEAAAQWRKQLADLPAK